MKNYLLFPMEILQIFTYTKQIFFLRIKKAQPIRKKLFGVEIEKSFSAHTKYWQTLKQTPRISF